MGSGEVHIRGRVAGFGAIAAIAAAAVAGCGAASSSTAAGTGTASPSATAPSSAAAAAGGGSADAGSAVQLAAKTASTANSATGTMSVQGTVKAGTSASPGTSAGTSGSAGSGNLSLNGTFSERIRPSLLVSATMSAGSSLPGGLSEILTSSTLYVKYPPLTQELHITKPWVSISLAKLSQGTGVDFSQMLSSVSNNGPLAQSQLLAGATSVKKTGTTTLAGVPVTEYTGTIDLAKAAAALTGSSKTQLQQAITVTGLRAATFTVWIDGQHVTRKAVVHETGKTISETVTTTITSINQLVNIAVPVAGQTAPLPTGTTPSTSTS